MDMDKNFDDLIELILEQAKKFLGEFGEFFPYASILTSNRDLKTIGVYNDNDDDFNAKKAIKIFEERIVEGILANEILIGAIGIDVIVNKQNAIMVRATDDGVRWQEKCYIYKFENGVVIIG